MSSRADSQVATERLFDHDAGVVGAAGLGQVFDDDAEQARRDRQVVQGPGRAVESLAQLVEGRAIVVIAVDVAEQLEQLGESGLVDAAVLGETVASPGLKLLERPARLGHPDHRYVEMPVLNQVLERGEDLLVGQVAGRPEKDEGVGMVLFHGGVFPVSAASGRARPAVRARSATAMEGRRMPSGRLTPAEPARTRPAPGREACRGRTSPTATARCTLEWSVRTRRRPESMVYPREARTVHPAPPPRSPHGPRAGRAVRAETGRR